MIHRASTSADHGRPALVAPTLILSLLLATTACGAPADEPTEPTEPAEPVATSESATEVEPATEATGTTDATIEGAGIRFTLPEGWQRQEPSSSMRMAQAAIPGTAGEGQLTVFFFGPGGGGGVDANLDRWAGQITGAEGEPSREEYESGELQITTIEHTGTLRASTMGTFPSTDQPGYALHGAVVEGPGGPWFFKAVGPQETLEEQSSAFREMLEDIELTSV